MLSLDGSDGKSYYLNTLTGDIYTKEFVQEGYKDVIASGRSTVSSADRVGNITTGTNFIKDNFKNTGEIIDDPAASPGLGANWSDTAAGAGATPKFPTGRPQNAPFNGAFPHISMGKQKGSPLPAAATGKQTGGHTLRWRAFFP